METMKIYISGKISGIPLSEVKAKFQEAQSFLENLGFDVVNPVKNGLTEFNTWEQHIVRDVELLLPCDAIYMFDGWMCSVGACIEYDISVRTGKRIFFESYLLKNKIVVRKIQNAIYEVMGLDFKEYIMKSRKRDYFFARMLFVYHSRKNGMTPKDISRYVKRDHTSIVYYSKKYNDEVKYNSNFRSLAQKVDEILKKYEQ